MFTNEVTTLMSTIKVVSLFFTTYPYKFQHKKDIIIQCIFNAGKYTCAAQVKDATWNLLSGVQKVLHFYCCSARAHHLLWKLFQVALGFCPMQWKIVIKLYVHSAI